MEKNIIEQVCQLKKCEDYIFYEMKSLKNSFLKVAFLLSYIKGEKLYLHEGYDDFYKYVEDKFALKSTSCKNLISIYNRFCDPVDYKQSSNFSVFLKEGYKNYSYSQLTELLSLDDISKITPDMTVREIRENKSYVKLYEKLKYDYYFDLDPFISEKVYLNDFKDLPLYKRCIYQFFRFLDNNKIKFSRYDFSYYLADNLYFYFNFRRYIDYLGYLDFYLRLENNKIYLSCLKLRLKNHEISSFDMFLTFLVKLLGCINNAYENDKIKKESIIKEEEQKTNLIYSNDRLYSISDLNIDEDIDEDIADFLNYINNNTKLAYLSTDKGLLFKAKKYDFVEIPLGNKFILRLDGYEAATLIDIVSNKEYRLYSDDMLKLFLHLFEKLGTFRDNYLTESIDQVFNNIKEEIELSEDDLIDNTENYNYDNIE